MGLTQLDYPHRAGLLVCIPLTGRPLPPQIMLCYASLMPPMNTNIRYIQVQGWPIDKAREFFAEKAIEFNCKWLFMMDEDVAVPSYAIRQLVHRLEHDEKAGLAAGIYCQKTNPTEPMVFRGKGGGPYWKWKAGELFECDSIGLGCSLVRVDVFKDLPKPWFKTVDDNDAVLDGVAKLVGWTEDIWFCNRLREAGWKVLADGGILPDHLDMQNGKATNLPPDSLPVQHLTATGKKKILDLGSGEFPYRTNEGKVVTCDIREEVLPDYRCDLRRLPFATGEFDIIHSSHVLEHFGRDEVGSVLDEWVRVLKEDGELRFVLPNLKWAAGQLLKDVVSDDVMNVLYGQQTYAQNYHKMGFTPETLRKMLEERKFKLIDIKMDGFNIICIATRKEPKKTRKAKAK